MCTDCTERPVKTFVFMYCRPVKRFFFCPRKVYFNRSQQTHYCTPQTIAEPILLCGTAHYLAERGHRHQGIPFP